MNPWRGTLIISVLLGANLLSMWMVNGWSEWPFMLPYLACYAMVWMAPRRTRRAEIDQLFWHDRDRQFIGLEKPSEVVHWKYKEAVK